ncbi:MAG: response regulator [Candidatus Manganitrophus sp.]|nr:response regulator [Candidatus Manganitrophus sp.]
MRFLVVEDEEKVARFVRRALEEESYAVDVVGDGEAALDQIEVVPYDMIFLDLTLSRKKGGWRFCSGCGKRGSRFRSSSSPPGRRSATG